MLGTRRFFILGMFLSTVAAASGGPLADKPPSFSRDILPLFQGKCVRCHGGDKQKAGLDLRSQATILKGGETGPAVVAGSSQKSLLWEMISKDKMPPSKEKLSDAEKQLVKAWIDGGARDAGAVFSVQDSGDRQVSDADRKFWSFQKPVRPIVPAVKSQDRVRNPIDAFLLAALEKNGLTFAMEADRLTLLRRACFDLTGLPPTPQEIDQFLADMSEHAYERMIDRLLASDHYGERWGRHWLDLAGYADSEGILDADHVRTAAWRYRDYVIRSFNRDKPYDRFLKEQIAGDELVDYHNAVRTQKALAPEVVDALIATGYLRCASDTSRPDFVNIKNAPGYYYQTLDDTLKIVASSTMGLTLECAKCHSHKYDPIPQTDYYRMQAIFMSAYRPYQWVAQMDRRIIEATDAQKKDAGSQADNQVTKLRKQIDELREEFAGYLFTGRLGKLPPQIRDDIRRALSAAPAKRTEVQKYLADKFEKELKPDRNTLDNLLPQEFPRYKTRLKELTAALATVRGTQGFPEIRALYDLPGEAKTPLLRRGDYLNPGPEVQPGVLSVLAADNPYGWKAPAKDAKTSGRRLAFADWLTQPDHPLTARVWINRLWLHHFGEGIVSTPDNFGRAGSPPSHPELLDWLATEFTRGGWSIKAMHRLIMTSAAYRQISTVSPAAKQMDPENRLLWRQRLRRLEAEVLRDTILAVSGTLNSEKHGPPVPMLRQGDGEVIVPNDASGRRRSVYLQVRRSQPLTLLQVFDQPVMETNCTRRGVSTVSSQALTLLNSDFLTRQAETFADRVLKENPEDPVGQALRLAFGRPATERERSKLAVFVETQTVRYSASLGGDKPQATGEIQQKARKSALVDLCHMLLNANEFVYVD